MCMSSVSALQFNVFEMYGLPICVYIYHLGITSYGFNVYMSVVSNKIFHVLLEAGIHEIHTIVILYFHQIS